MPDPIKDSPTEKKIKKPLSAKDKDKIINIAFFVILIIGLINSVFCFWTDFNLL